MEMMAHNDRLQEKVIRLSSDRSAIGFELKKARRKSSDLEPEIVIGKVEWTDTERLESGAKLKTADV